MAKKRTSLDSLFNENLAVESKIDNQEIVVKKENNKPKFEKVDKPEAISKENKIVKQTVYLPNQVYEQLRLLAFEERKKMHDYLVEGLDRVFKNRGLKSFSELNKQ